MTFFTQVDGNRACSAGEITYVEAEIQDRAVSSKSLPSGPLDLHI